MTARGKGTQHASGWRTTVFLFLYNFSQTGTIIFNGLECTFERLIILMLATREIECTWHNAFMYSCVNIMCIMYNCTYIHITIWLCVLRFLMKVLHTEQTIIFPLEEYLFSYDGDATFHHQHRRPLVLEAYSEFSTSDTVRRITLMRQAFIHSLHSKRDRKLSCVLKTWELK